MQRTVSGAEELWQRVWWARQQWTYPMACVRGERIHQKSKPPTVISRPESSPSKCTFLMDEGLSGKLRCRGTPRGHCGSRLRTPQEVLWGRCRDCQAEHEAQGDRALPEQER